MMGLRPLSLYNQLFRGLLCYIMRAHTQVALPHRNPLRARDDVRVTRDPATASVCTCMHTRTRSHGRT